MPGEYSHMGNDGGSFEATATAHSSQERGTMILASATMFVIEPNISATDIAEMISNLDPVIITL